MSVISDVGDNLTPGRLYVNAANPKAKVSDTDLSTSTMLTVTAQNANEAPPTNRKACSLGDLTRITWSPSGNDDASLERTVSLDFKPVSPHSQSSSSSRAMYNLAMQDLSRVGEDSDEDYNLNRKRPASNYDNLIITGSELEVTMPKYSNRTLLAVDTDGSDVNIRPLDSNDPETLWFGTTSIQMVETVQTTVSFTQIESSANTDLTLTTSLGTSPSESSSDGRSSSSPISPEPNDNSPDLIQMTSQVKHNRIII